MPPSDNSPERLITEKEAATRLGLSVRSPHSKQYKGAAAQKKDCTPVLNDPFHILLSEKQAANYLGLTDRALQQRRYASLPPEYIKLPGSSAVRYRLSVLMEFVAQGEVPLP